MEAAAQVEVAGEEEEARAQRLPWAVLRVDGLPVLTAMEARPRRRSLLEVLLQEETKEERIEDRFMVESKPHLHVSAPFIYR